MPGNTNPKLFLIWPKLRENYQREIRALFRIFHFVQNKKKQYMNAYKIPAQTRIGHIHLKVANIQRSLDFYCNLLGFDLITMYGKDAAFISAGGYHHHIGLNTWYSKDAAPAPLYSTGLFHTAILYPQRKDLAAIYQRIKNAGYPFTGFADHGVSEALYLNDPDENGVELYWDKPGEIWPKDEKGQITMYTRALDVNNLLAELSLQC